MAADEIRECVLRFSQYAEKSAFSGSLVNVVFSSPNAGDCLKIKGVPRLISGNRMIQLEHFYTEGRVSQRNVSSDELGQVISENFQLPFMRVDLNDRSGSASLMASRKGKVTAVIPASLRDALDKAEQSVFAGTAEYLQNNREKNHVLRGDEPFLIALGISDKNGRVHDKKQAKFRQICRFSEHVMEAASRLDTQKELYIADLCCGKSYLSFAVYHCLRNIVGCPVEMICVDLKKSVMDECEQIARRLHFDGMHFRCADITAFQPKRRPDMVISLHACDTATDIVLDFAAGYGVPVILSTPCCQRQLSRDLDCTALAFIASKPALRKKFCDAATDALRLSRLQAYGYTADALEFIDPEDTPKNIMLRAYRKKNFKADGPSAKRAWDEYAAAYRFLCAAEPPALKHINNES